MIKDNQVVKVELIQNEQKVVEVELMRVKVELMRMATDLALNILSKTPTYRGKDDNELMLKFTVKTFDECIKTVANNYKTHFPSLPQ